MTIENHFQIAEDKRAAFIDGHILAHLSEEAKEAAKEKVTKTVNSFQGQDMNALSVLHYAAQQGKLDQYIEKLGKHFEENLYFTHPGARTMEVAGTGGPAERAERFFLDCYRELGIEPQKR